MHDEIEELKRRVCDQIDASRDALLRISHEIHAHPELAFEEVRAAALLASALEEAGLTVERGAYGLDTAFATEFGNEGSGRLALLAEYDALPGIGHACGHNLIATASIGAGLALAHLAERVPGRVRVLGTPAEEHGCGKELMARERSLRRCRRRTHDPPGRHVNLAEHAEHRDGRTRRGISPAGPPTLRGDARAAASTRSTR